MSDIPAGDVPPEDSDSKTDLMGESVQNYLDDLLTPDTEPLTKVTERLESSRLESVGLNNQQKKRESDFAKRDMPLSHPVKSPLTASQPVQAFKSVVAQSLPAFAEPELLNPLPKMPLPRVKEAKPVNHTSDPVISDTVKVSPLPIIDKIKQPPVIEKAKPEIMADTETEPDSVSEQAEAISPTRWLDNGRPDWAQQEFECLLFSVGGLTLAVPLIELGSIYPKSEELTPIFGQIDWFMGLMAGKEEGSNIKVVNTAKVVMPERYIDSMKDDYSYIISINHVDWGLAVDTVATAITLQPEDVKWRSSRSKRPWLAGTVVDHMCALLDISQLAMMFNEYDKKSL